MKDFKFSAPSPDQCPRIFADAGVTDGFAPLVAHAIHSIALEDIRYYFKSDATEDNGIPTGRLQIQCIISKLIPDIRNFPC